MIIVLSTTILKIIESSKLLTLIAIRANDGKIVNNGAWLINKPAKVPAWLLFYLL